MADEGDELTDATDLFDLVEYAGLKIMGDVLECGDCDCPYLGSILVLASYRRFFRCPSRGPQIVARCSTQIAWKMTLESTHY